MDGELMDLAEAFDDNPDDAIKGEGGENPNPEDEEVVEGDEGAEVVEGDEEGADDSDEAEDAELEIDPDAEEIVPPVLADDTKVELVVDGKTVTKTFGELKVAAQKY
jgi:hypothetical protein